MNIYDFTVNNNKGEKISLSQYKGKVILIVNTATKCGLTPQYEALEATYKKYAPKGLEILDFPCNQFLEQAPETDSEIETFCSLTFGTTFPRFQKIDVNGEAAHPLYAYLKDNSSDEDETQDSLALTEKLKGYGQIFPGSDIKWNFTKFLIDKNGEIVKRFPPTTKPIDMEEELEEYLNK